MVCESSWLEETFFPGRPRRPYQSLELPHELTILLGMPSNDVVFSPGLTRS